MITENIQFLATAGQDGYFPVNFGKMLPYGGTPIEQQLRDSGRLTGTVTHPDYEFLNPDLNWYAFLVQKLFARRNFSPEGIASLQNTDFEYRLTEAFNLKGSERLQQGKLRDLISQSNTLATQTLKNLLDAIGTMGAAELLKEENTLLSIADKEWTGESIIQHENNILFNELYASFQ